ncbi:MAG: glycosyltransferase family 4 protein [Candidatus Heimdallarchaeota archaeon]
MATKASILFIGPEKMGESVFKSQRYKFEGLSKCFDPHFLTRPQKFGFNFRKISLYDCKFYIVPFSHGPGMVVWLVTSLCMAIFLCRRKNIDVIIAQDPLLSGFVGYVAKAITRKKLIIECHGDWKGPTFRRYHSLLPGRVQDYILGRISAFLLHKADSIRVVSSYLRKQVKFIVQDKEIFQFPAFMNIDFFLESRREEENVDPRSILFVGSPPTLKGLKYLIIALGMILPKYQSARLLVVSENKWEKNIAQFAEKIHLERNVVFLGELTQSQLRDWFSRSEMLVLPSVSEGFGRVLVEAMACGLPVIGTEVGGITEIIEDGKTGFIVSPRDSKALASRIELILSDFKISRTLGANARKNIKENYSNNAFFDDYTTLVKHTLLLL